jgi:hypothetical protein
LVAVREAHGRAVPQLTREDLDQCRPGTPCDVKAGHGIAVSLSAVAAALGPAHQRKDLQAPVAQPAAFLSGREIDVGMRPLAWPVVLFTIKRRRPQPVLQRKFVAVANAQAALLRAVDEKQAAERPEGLPTQVGAVLLVHDQHPQAAIHQFAGGDQARQARSDNDGVGRETGS